MNIITTHPTMFKTAVLGVLHPLAILPQDDKFYFQSGTKFFTCSRDWEILPDVDEENVIQIGVKIEHYDPNRKYDVDLVIQYKDDLIYKIWIKSWLGGTGHLILNVEDSE